jgi:hypothetical protein
VFGATALVLGYPHLLLHGIHPEKVIGAEAIAEEGGMNFGGTTLVLDVRWESFPRLAVALFGYDPAIVVLGLVGLAFALARRELRAPSIFLVAWSAFFMTNRSDHVRYLLPALVFLCWPAGVIAEELLERKWGTAFLALALLLPTVQCLRLACLLARPDTRAEAETALAALGPGARVAIDRYGPEVDLDRASLVRLERLRTSVGEPLRARESRRKRRFEEGALPPERAGIDAVHLEELLEFDERARTLDVKSGLSALGSDPGSGAPRPGRHPPAPRRAPSRIARGIAARGPDGRRLCGPRLRSVRGADAHGAGGLPADRDGLPAHGVVASGAAGTLDGAVRARRPAGN